ncbi:alpha-mannosidase 1 [Phlegmacium glaucopus]|nr:alpha-mannosidase 1 [Phlegmacium glaucopus]
MLVTHTFIFALGAFLSLPQTILGGLVQSQDLVFPSPIDATKNRDAVKKIFTDSYGVYHKFAFGHDEVAPISQTALDGRNGWGATIVDALDTMARHGYFCASNWLLTYYFQIIMGLNDLFTEAVDHMSTVDFSKSNTADTVSVFESTIRYVGGLLSAYEMSDRRFPVLLAKAKQLADKLAFAWVGNNDIPFGFIDIDTNSPVVDTSNIAEAGTLTIEWATLSKYTGNDTYRILAEKSARHIAQIGSPLPGLPAQGVDPKSGEAVGGYVTWGGGSDSYFEYLIKYARLNNTVDPLFADTWRTAVDSSIKTLLRTSIAGNHAYLADYDSAKRIRHISSHLACFHGGNWLLGGRLLNNDTMVDIGLELVDGCWNTYASTATGIGPEIFAFSSFDGGFTGGDPPTAEQILFNDLHGFYIIAPDYVLRPEVLESNFYAWRVTGDSKYLDRAAKAVKSFQTYLQVSNGGYAGIWDVTDNGASGQPRVRVDDTESFWFAEVLKYLYLTFDDPNHISLDEYVFNTEAHPFKVPASSPGTAYGTGSIISSLLPFKTVPGNLPLVSAIPGIPGLVFGLADIATNVLTKVVGGGILG